MKPSTKIALLLVPALAVGLLLAWTRLRSDLARETDAPPTIVAEDLTHRVSDSALSASRLMLERAAPSFTLPASDSRTFELDALLRRGPVVLTFIKLGCPCSEAAQPFFNRLRAAYPTATFLGVIDADEDVARGWAARHYARYPLLLDPAMDLVRAYQAENSAYIVVIDPGHHIAAYWPGYSAAMLRELGETLARLTSTPLVELDVADAPAELYTGCPYLF